MRIFPVFLLLFTILLAFSAATARAEICSQPLKSHLSDREGLGASLRHLKATAEEQCDQHWSGTLARSGVSAKIQSEQGMVANMGLLVAKVRRGLETADDALIKISPDGQVGDHINVILSNFNVEGTGSPDAYAYYLDNECTLVITPKSQRYLGEPGVLAFTMAHELFHCVQHAVIFNFDDRLNVWWSEGSANWFAYMAQPLVRINAYSEFEREFERDAQNKTLGNFSYQNWPFFAWLAQDRGSAQAVILFLNGLPKSRHHSDADIAALLSPDDWDEFAKKYSAYQIKISESLPLDPRPRARLSETNIHLPNIGDVRNIPFHMRTGGLNRYQINLEEGEWELSTTLAGTMYLGELLTSGDPGPNWQKISAGSESLKLSVACEEDKSYALVGFGSAPDTHDFTLTAEKTDDPCAPTCTSIPAGRDACLIGIWEDQHTAEPYISAMETVEDVIMPAPLLTFSPDGGYTKDDPLTTVSEVLGSRITTTIDVARTLGEWGSTGSKLAVCETTQITKGTVHTVHPDGELTIPIDSDEALDPVRDLEYIYTCDDSTLTLKTKSVLGMDFGLNLTYKRQ